MSIVDHCVSKDLEVFQILCGRDIAKGGYEGEEENRAAIFAFAAQMQNFCYVVKIVSENSCILVDPAWDIKGLLELCRTKLKVKTIRAAVYTHRHFDHMGGLLPKFMTGGKRVRLEGLAELARSKVPVFVGTEDLGHAARQSGLDAASIRPLKDGDIIPVDKSSSVVGTVVHTPGHTPGSLCLRVCKKGGEEGLLFTGDTLFVGSCGRSDLPESNARDLFRSLAKLAKLPKTTVVCPGHNYAAQSKSTIGEEVRTNFAIGEALRVERALPKLGRSNTSAESVSLALPNYLEAAWSVFDRRDVGICAKADDHEKSAWSFRASCCGGGVVTTEYPAAACDIFPRM